MAESRFWALSDRISRVADLPLQTALFSVGLSGLAAASFVPGLTAVGELTFPLTLFFLGI